MELNLRGIKMEDKISKCIKDFLEEYKNKITPSHKDKDRNDKKFDNKIYNECSLQYELGIWLRDKLKSDKVGIKYEIYFEKNTKTFLNNCSGLSKCEVDLIIIGRVGDEIKEKYAIELKFPINGQYPEQMKKFIEDMKFMKKIYSVWGKEELKNCNTYCLTLVNDSNFYKVSNRENKENKDLYYQFRSGQQEEKIIKTKKKIDDTEIKLKKYIEWHLLNKDKNNESIRYYLVNIKKDVIQKLNDNQ